MIPAVLAVQGIALSNDGSVVGETTPLEVYSFQPNIPLVIAIAGIAFLLGVIFFLVQTALGSVSRISSGDDQKRNWFWEKSTPDSRVSWRLFERRCWAMGILCHLTFLVYVTSFFLSEANGSVPLQLMIVVPVILTLQFLFFDLFIRQVAIRYSDPVLKWLAGTAWTISYPLQPLFLILWSMTGSPENTDEKLQLYSREREFRLLPHISEVDQVVEEGAAELMDSVREFMDSKAKDIMTPRTEIDGIEIGSDREAIFDKLKNTSYSRIVVYRGNLDHIEGFLLAKEVLLNPSRNPLDFTRRPVVADSDMHLSDLLRMLKKQKSYLAVVVDEYGGTSGIITLQDLFMAVMGNRLEDAGENESLWIEPDQDGFILSGRVELWEANQEMGTELDESFARTIGGFIMHHAGRLPEEGESITCEAGEFKIMKVENNRVEMIRFTSASAEDHENAVQPEVAS